MVRCIDTHCHYNLEPLFSGQTSHFSLKTDDPILHANWQTHWQAASAKGVIGGIVVGADLESSKRAITINQQQARILPSVGIHPGVISEITAQFVTDNPHATADDVAGYLGEIFHVQMAVLADLATKPQVIAIGETGCDYFHFDEKTAFPDIQRHTQMAVFTEQIQLANTLGLPLIIHVRDRLATAYTDTLELIKKHFSFHTPFVLHCASGPLTYITAAVELGAFVGFDGNLTYKNNQDLLAILQAIPLDKVVAETDAPYLPPVPYRGKVCEPWMVTEVVNQLGKSATITSDQLLANTASLFGTPITTLLADQSS